MVGESFESIKVGEDLKEMLVLLKAHYRLKPADVLNVQAIASTFASEFLEPRLAEGAASPQTLINVECALRVVLGLVIRTREDMRQVVNRAEGVGSSDPAADADRELQQIKDEICLTSFDPASCLVIIGMLQLALRHPGATGQAAMIARSCAQGLAEWLSAKSPAAKSLIDLGWEGAVR